MDHHHRGHLEHAWHVVRANYERFTVRPVHRKRKDKEKTVQRIKSSTSVFHKKTLSSFHVIIELFIGIKKDIENSNDYDSNNNSNSNSNSNNDNNNNNNNNNNNDNNNNNNNNNDNNNNKYRKKTASIHMFDNQNLIHDPGERF